MEEIELLTRLQEIAAGTADEHTEAQINDLIIDRWGRKKK